MAIGDPTKVSATPDGVVQWSMIDWQTTIKAVERLQARIAEAVKEERWGKVRSLQRLLVRSLPARRLAVRRVTTSPGARTPGIDGVHWDTPRKKMMAVDDLRRRGYKPKPLRRTHIPKRNGKKRALGIPCMIDRAMQTLHAMALEPVAEQNADPNSYGFRKARSIQDAHVRGHMVLAKPTSASWVLDADIEACFDNISHDWMLDHIPMDKSMLRRWLKAGYFDGDLFHTTEQGTPQGGPISPLLANMTLDGLEAKIRAALPLQRGDGSRPKVYPIRYADDLMVTASTRELLEETVLPIVAAFLEPRGLHLSKEKTKIVHIDEGFDFLGANVRKFNGKLLMRPTKANVRELLRKTRTLIRRNRGTKTEDMLRQLNRVLQGWAHQFRHLTASRTFSSIDFHIFRQLWRWALRRHRNKGHRWVKRKYFTANHKSDWVFHAQRVQQGRSETITLFRMKSLPIRRHIKVRAEAKFHDAEYAKYFSERRRLRRLRRHHRGPDQGPGHQLKLPLNPPEQSGRRSVGL